MNGEAQGIDLCCGSANRLSGHEVKRDDLDVGRRISLADIVYRLFGPGASKGKSSSTSRFNHTPHWKQMAYLPLYRSTGDNDSLRIGSEGTDCFCAEGVGANTGYDN